METGTSTNGFLNYCQETEECEVWCLSSPHVIYINTSCMHAYESSLGANKPAEHLPAHCLCSRPEMLMGGRGSPVHELLTLGEGPPAALLDSCDTGAGDSSL